MPMSCVAPIALNTVHFMKIPNPTEMHSRAQPCGIQNNLWCRPTFSGTMGPHLVHFFSSNFRCISAFSIFYTTDTYTQIIPKNDDLSLLIFIHLCNRNGYTIILILAFLDLDHDQLISCWRLHVVFDASVYMFSNFVPLRKELIRISIWIFC